MTGPANNHYESWQEQIQQDLKARIKAHQHDVQRAKALHARGASAPAPLILVGDGDSWFDYPLPDPLHPTDVLQALRTAGEPAPMILKLAHYSDATTTLLGVTKRNRLIAQLQDPANGPIEALLFSGGGNDVVGDQFRFWLNDASAVGNDSALGVNIQRLGDIFGVVESAYLDLIRIRDQCAPHAPIFVHAYDFAIPTGIAACHLAGPWLRPSLVDRGWSGLAPGALIVKTILAQFRAMLQRLASEPTHNMVLVETQGTLAPGDWANELHPTGAGFAKIAARFRAALATRFAHRI
ncbi:SGNH/GDSL hydrolase family protein [Paraburkholderia sp. LEh10]|uniref:SGNH/GDSL hydrolase family protein n=1 Tax=Paraburkholderia sp. LEh10 TaxID=2821353 RepID=UPI001AE14D23|nr:SGNH/GDSL hydrolase family protein [Paraburkholderia sp. LEh10]MBP0590155.1 SGNH/GDSL hydrolase family protein [Paraburkholderia sp. LEh10]